MRSAATRLSNSTEGSCRPAVVACARTGFPRMVGIDLRTAAIGATVRKVGGTHSRCRSPATRGRIVPDEARRVCKQNVRILLFAGAPDWFTGRMRTRGVGFHVALLTMATIAWGASAEPMAWAMHEGSWIRVASPSTGTFSYSGLEGQTSTGHGAPGSTIKVTAGALKPKPAKYTLLYAPPGSGLDCSTATQILKNRAGVDLKKMTTNGGGKLDRDLTLSGVQPYKAVIPADSPTGTAVLCATEFLPVPGNTRTRDVAFTVT